jgi:hypothetical protein
METRKNINFSDIKVTIPIIKSIGFRVESKGNVLKPINQNTNFTEEILLTGNAVKTISSHFQEQNPLASILLEAKFKNKGLAKYFNEFKTTDTKKQGYLREIKKEKNTYNYYLFLEQFFIEFMENFHLQTQKIVKDVENGWLENNIIKKPANDFSITRVNDKKFEFKLFASELKRCYIVLSSLEMEDWNNNFSPDIISSYKLLTSEAILQLIDGLKQLTNSNYKKGFDFFYASTNYWLVNKGIKKYDLKIELLKSSANFTQLENSVNQKTNTLALVRKKSMEIVQHYFGGFRSELTQAMMDKIVSDTHNHMEAIKAELIHYNTDFFEDSEGLETLIKIIILKEIQFNTIERENGKLTDNFKKSLNVLTDKIFSGSIVNERQELKESFPELFSKYLKNYSYCKKELNKVKMKLGQEKAKLKQLTQAKSEANRITHFACIVEEKDSVFPKLLLISRESEKLNKLYETYSSSSTNQNESDTVKIIQSITHSGLITLINDRNSILATKHYENNTDKLRDGDHFEIVSETIDFLVNYSKKNDSVLFYLHAGIQTIKKYFHDAKERRSHISLSWFYNLVNRFLYDVHASSIIEKTELDNILSDKNNFLVELHQYDLDHSANRENRPDRQHFSYFQKAITVIDSTIFPQIRITPNIKFSFREKLVESKLRNRKNSDQVNASFSLSIHSNSESFLKNNSDYMDLEGDLKDEVFRNKKELSQTLEINKKITSKLQSSITDGEDIYLYGIDRGEKEHVTLSIITYNTKNKTYELKGGLTLNDYVLDLGYKNSNEEQLKLRPFNYKKIEIDGFEPFWVRDLSKSLTNPINMIRLGRFIEDLIEIIKNNDIFVESGGALDEKITTIIKETKKGVFSKQIDYFNKIDKNSDELSKTIHEFFWKQTKNLDEKIELRLNIDYKNHDVKKLSQFSFTLGLVHEIIFSKISQFEKIEQLELLEKTKILNYKSAVAANAVGIISHLFRHNNGLIILEDFHTFYNKNTNTTQTKNMIEKKGAITYNSFENQLLSKFSNFPFDLSNKTKLIQLTPSLNSIKILNSELLQKSLSSVFLSGFENESKPINKKVKQMGVVFEVNHNLTSCICPVCGYGNSQHFTYCSQSCGFNPNNIEINSKKTVLNNNSINKYTLSIENANSKISTIDQIASTNVALLGVQLLKCLES